MTLDVYKVLGGRYTLTELTYMYRNKELNIFIDNETKKVTNVYENGYEIYKRNIDTSFNTKQEDAKRVKITTRSQQKIQLIVNGAYGRFYYDKREGFVFDRHAKNLSNITYEELNKLANDVKYYMDNFYENDIDIDNMRHQQNIFNIYNRELTKRDILAKQYIDEKFNNEQIEILDIQLQTPYQTGSLFKFKEMEL